MRPLLKTLSASAAFSAVLRSSMPIRAVSRLAQPIRLVVPSSILPFLCLDEDEFL